MWNRLSAPMTAPRSRIGKACTEWKPAASASAANRGQRPSTVARSWFTTGSPVGSSRGTGPSWACSSNSSRTRMASLDEAITRRSPSGAASMSPAASTSSTSTQRSASSVSSSTTSKSATRVSASSTSVLASIASLGIGISRPAPALGLWPGTRRVGARSIDGICRLRTRGQRPVTASGRPRRCPASKRSRPGHDISRPRRRAGGRCRRRGPAAG